MTIQSREMIKQRQHVSMQEEKERKKEWMERWDDRQAGAERTGAFPNDDEDAMLRSGFMIGSSSEGEKRGRFGEC